MKTTSAPANSPRFLKQQRPGFTLLEILVAVALVALMVTITMPRLIRRNGTTEWSVILEQLNNMITIARQEAIATRSRLRVAFCKGTNGKADFVIIEQEVPNPDKPGTVMYKTAPIAFFPPTQQLPQGITFLAVYLRGTEQLAENKGKGYCYIIHEGVVQDILIHMQRKIGDISDIASFKMEPFLGRFTFSEGLLKPQK